MILKCKNAILSVLYPFLRAPKDMVRCFLIVVIFSSPEPKAQGELIVYQSSRRLAVCLWTFSNSNISATSGPIVTKF